MNEINNIEKLKEIAKNISDDIEKVGYIFEHGSNNTITFKFNNIEKLKEIAKNISDAIEKDGSNNTITFKFNNTSIETENRLPNELEKRRYLINLVWELKIKDIITTCQYRTVKGQLRRGFYDIGLNFIAKRGNEAIKEDFISFCETEREHAYTKLQFTPTKPININTLDFHIKSNKENDCDEQKSACT